jgi:hypothetical protein
VVWIFAAAMQTFTKDTALLECGRGAAQHVWISATWHGRGTAWTQHCMCELALNRHLRNRTAFTSDLCNRRFMLNSDCNGHVHTYIGERGNIILLVMCIRRLSHFKLPSSSICAIILGNGPFYVICVRNNLHESELKRHLRIHTG